MLKFYESLPRKTDTQDLAITSYKVDAFILQNHLPGMASKKHPSFGGTEADLPLEMSYGKALDPTNNIPEAISRSIVAKALPWTYIGLNMKDKHSNIPY